MKTYHLLMLSVLCLYWSKTYAMNPSVAELRARADARIRQGQEDNRRLQAQRQQSLKRAADALKEIDRPRQEALQRQRMAKK